MDKVDVEGAFVALRAQWQLLKMKPDVEIAKSLSSSIQKRSSPEIQYLLQYILFPIQLHLCNDKLDKQTRRQLVELLRSVLSKARIIQMDCFVKLYTSLLVQIYHAEGENMLISSHEELKESTVKCLGELIRSASTDVVESLYERKNCAKLSQAVYACLSVTKTEKLVSLRLAATETLMTLFQVDDGADINDVVHRDRVARTVMFFLPGIAHGLHRVALGNDVQNHKITQMAIRAFGRIVALIMQDEEGNEKLTLESVMMREENMKKSFDPLGNLFKLEGEKGMKKHLETTERSEAWLEAASLKLNGLIRSLVGLVGHAHPRVRKELLFLAKLLISRCSRNMSHNLMELVEIIISLSEDEVEEIATLSRSALDELNEKLTRNHGARPVVELLEEHFYKLVTNLPRLIRRSENSIQLTRLNQLAGYIKLLGKQRLPRVMASVSHLRRLLLALVYVAELDSSHVSILDNVETSSTTTDMDNSVYMTAADSWKRYKFIGDKSTEEKLLLICKLLGELGDVALLVDGIIDLSLEMPQYRKELTLVLNCVSGGVAAGESSRLLIHKQIIDYYTEPDNWYLPIEPSPDVSLGEAQSNIVNCCLLVEGLGNIASNVRREYDKYLLKTLYLVIERAGSGKSVIAQAGLGSLEKIAQSQNNESVAHLLENNIDYVCFHVTMKMRRVERNPGVLDVFSIVMRYGTIDLLPYLQGVVQDALVQLSSINVADNKSESCKSLLRLLYIFTICVKKLTEDKREDGNGTTREGATLSPSPPPPPSKAQIVVQSLVEHYEAIKAGQNIEERVAIDPRDIEKELMNGEAAKFAAAYDNQGEEESGKMEEPPDFVKMTEEVMKCCLNFLPSKEMAKSLLAMEILAEGLDILANWSEQLLPLVHQMWHPLTERFNDSNLLVMNRAWQLLCTLARVSQDFIKSRTLRQVVPSLEHFLTKSAEESYKKEGASAYEFTQVYKLQKNLLARAGIVAKDLSLAERELWQILEIAQPYLSSFQHPILQKCCVQLYKDVAACNSHIVWVKCLGIWNQRVATIPPDHGPRTLDLKALSSGGGGGDGETSDYETNVESIIRWIEQMDRLGCE